MKRILFLINDLGVGGAQKVFLRDMKDLEAEGYTVKIVTLFKGRSDDRQAEICLNLRRTSLGIISGVGPLKQIIKNFSPDIVISTLDEANTLLKLTACLSWGNSIKYFVREANEADKKGVKYKISDIALSLLRVRVIAVSEAVKKTLVSYLPWVEKKVFVVPNGIDIAHFASEAVPDGNDKSAIVVLTVGSLTRKKNHEFLLRSFALAMRELEQAQNSIRHKVSLNIVGQGEELSRLQKIAEDLDIADKITFVGKIAPDIIASSYSRADIFALSSSREGFPNVLLEAMAYSLPIVTTNAGAAPEIVENGKTGFVWHKGDLNSYAQSLVSLILDGELRRKMGQTGRQRLEQLYTQKKHLAKLKEVLGV